MKKLGLLICDHVKPEYLEEHGTYPEMFIKLLPEFEHQVYYVCDGKFPTSPDECDCWLVNGSHKSAYEEIDWIIQLKSFIREIFRSGKKFVGVCFGHQILAEALGGKVAKSEKGWKVGVCQAKILQKESWMNPAKESYKILMMCQDQVNILPKESTILAQTKNCPIAMYQVGTNMLGIQGHPEFTKAYDQALMEARIDRIGEDTVNKGLNSLDLHPDQDLLAKWIERFLRKTSI